MGDSLISSNEPLDLCEDDPLLLPFLPDDFDGARDDTRLVLDNSDDLFEPFLNLGGLTLSELLDTLPLLLDPEDAGLL